MELTTIVKLYYNRVIKENAKEIINCRKRHEYCSDIKMFGRLDRSWDNIEADGVNEMGVYPIGELIRRTRESLGIARKDLCEGICTLETLCRIENGNRSPNRANFQALMERMGKSGEKYMVFVHSDDIDLIEKGKELEALLTSRKFEELENKVADLKQQLDVEDGVNRQYIIRMQALAEFETGKISAKEKRKLLEEALRCTVPRYQEGIVPKGLFSRNEILLYCNIAVSYAQEKNFNMALVIFRQLVQYFENTNIDMEERSISETLLLCNLSQCFGQNGNLEESIETGEKAIKLCISTGKCGVLPNLLYCNAYMHELLDQDNNHHKKRMIQAYYVAELNGNKRSMDHILKHMKEVTFKP